MITSVDTEFTGRIRVSPLFDVLYVGPIDPNWYIMLRFACYGACMASYACPVIYNESEVCHLRPFHATVVVNGSCHPISNSYKMVDPASHAPTMEPIFPIAVTMRTLPTLFFQKRDTSSNARKS